MAMLTLNSTTWVPLGWIRVHNGLSGGDRFRSGIGGSKVGCENVTRDSAQQVAFSPQMCKSVGNSAVCNDSANAAGAAEVSAAPN
jgi:hypothetical protein